MEAAPSAEVIRATQDSLGKFVKRPPLTEKLLKKPPFRFLHDVITSVLRSNGFFEGLFEEAELSSENVKDREAKILFLTKVINVLSLTTGKTLKVKPSKIISGQEPEKTNEFLLYLGLALEQNLSTSEAVKTYKQNSNTLPNSEKIAKKSQDKSVSKPPTKTREDGNLTSKSSENLKRQNEKKQIDKKESTLAKKDGNKREKRDTSVPKNDVNKIRKTEKEKKEASKDGNRERIKNRDKSVTKQSSTDNLSKTLPSTQASTDKNIIDSKKIEGDKRTDRNNALRVDSELINLELVTSDNIEKKLNDVVKPPHETGSTQKEEENIHYKEVELVDNGLLHHHEEGNNELTTPLNPSTKLIKGNDNEQSSDNDADDILEENVNKAKFDINKDQDHNTTAENLEINMPSKLSEPSEIEQMSTSKRNNFEINANKLESGIEVLPNKSSSEDTVNMIRSEVPLNKPTTPVVYTRSNFLRPPTARPPSARPGAPRLRDKHDEVLSAIEPIPTGKVHVIVENSGIDNEEDEESLMFVETATEQSADSEAELAMQHSSKDHGHLVQQILDSQKEFSQMQTGKTEIEWEFGAQRAREASSHEVEQLRINLQALSRVANPLGKLLDHIQEDVEVMRQELQQWTKTYEDAKAELAKEKSGTEQALQPLQAKNKQMDEEITDKREKISDLKSIIHKNSTRIDKLLASGNVQ